jgi:uncharacterized membrane protein YkvI
MITKRNVPFWVTSLGYIAAFIGAGFISGQELAQFFVRFGFMGMIGWFLMILFITIGGGFVMEKLAFYKFDSFHKFSVQVFGEKMSFLIDLVINGYLLGGLIIMLSGSGNLVTGIVKLPFVLGIFIISFAVLLIIIGKSQRLIAANKILVPLLIVFILIISIRILFSSNFNLDLKSVYIIRNPSIFLTNWFLSVLLYVGYNAIGAIVALINISKNTLPANGKIGGIVGGLIISLLGSLLLLILFITYPQWINAELPMVDIVSSMKDKFFYPIFVPCMIVAMFNVSIAYAMGISNYLVDKFGLDYKVACLLVVLVSSPLALLGFSKLLGVIYPLFGILATLLVLYVGIRFLVDKTRSLFQ